MDNRAILISVVLLLFSKIISCEVDSEDFKYIGCFDLSYSLRLNYHRHIAGITFERCVDLCRNLDTNFAGVEKSDNFCYCGPDIAEGSVNRDDSQCNVLCDEGHNRTCGGDWLMSLYEVGFHNTSVVTDESVKFLVGISMGARLYSSNVKIFNNVATTSDWVHGIDYHFAKNEVYLFVRGKLFRGTMDKKNTPAEAVPTEVSQISLCEGFAIDWVLDKIYWMNCSGVNQLMSMGLNGEDVKTVFKRPVELAVVKRMEIDPYKKILFWMADGVIESCTALGNNFRTNMSVTDVGVRAFTLDLRERRVYYVGALNDSNTLYSMDYDGGASRIHFSSPQIRSVYGIGIVNGTIYWVTYADTRDVVYKAPLTINSTHKDSIVKIDSIDKAVWHMKVVHQDVQKQPGDDPCDHVSCSYYCVSNSTSARCSCPQGMELSLDETTCIKTVKPTVLPRWYGNESIHYVGCFGIDYSTIENLNYNLPNMSFDSCAIYCTAKGKKYAGISDKTCFCGSNIAERSSRSDDAYCNTPCSTNSPWTCGGEFLMSLYELKIDGPKIEEESLRFLVSHNTGVLQYNSSNLNKSDIIMTTRDWSFTIDYHIHKNILFVYSSAQIFKSSLTPKTSSSPLFATSVKNVTSCDGFSIDWITDTIYWVDCDEDRNYIMAMDFEGKSLTKVFNRPLEVKIIRRMEIDPYRRILFWIAGGVLESCLLTGDEFQTNLSTAEVQVRALALDLNSQRVYYVGILNHVASLFSMDYVGGAYKKHFSSLEMSSVYGLSLYKDHAYWVNYIGFKDIMYRAPLDTVGNDSIQALKSFTQAVWNFRIVHPELQKRPTMYSCKDKGCSYFCKVHSPSSVTCLCPKGEVLDANGVTCSKRISIGMVVLSLMVVLLVIGAAVAMVYFTDNYWSDLRLKLFGVPYSRSRETQRESSVTPVYDTEGDNVNLI